MNNLRITSDNDMQEHYKMVHQICALYLGIHYYNVCELTNFVHSHCSLGVFTSKQVPVMIVYGEKDGGGKSGSNRLKHFPNSDVFEMKDAPHPSYIDKPEEWRRLVYNYIKQAFHNQ